LQPFRYRTHALEWTAMPSLAVTHDKSQNFVIKGETYFAYHGKESV